MISRCEAVTEYTNEKLSTKMEIEVARSQVHAQTVSRLNEEEVPRNETDGRNLDDLWSHSCETVVEYICRQCASLFGCRHTSAL